MRIIDWILFNAMWMLIPAALLLKYYLDRRWKRVFKKTQPIIDEEIRKIFSNKTTEEVSE